MEQTTQPAAPLKYGVRVMTPHEENTILFRFALHAKGYADTVIRQGGVAEYLGLMETDAEEGENDV